MISTLSSKLFPDLCRAFGYRKRNVFLSACTSITITGVNWSGGSRTIYTQVFLESLSVQTAGHLGVPASWNNPYEGAEIKLEPGKLIVTTGTFMGKTATMHIYVHPDNMPALLEEFPDLHPARE